MRKKAGLLSLAPVVGLLNIPWGPWMRSSSPANREGSEHRFAGLPGPHHQRVA